MLTGGAIIELDNGWQLTTARIAGDEVVEVVLNGVPANRAELERYGLSEEVTSYKRRWFVTVEEAARSLPKLLACRRAVTDVTARDLAGALVRHRTGRKQPRIGQDS